MEYEYTIRAIIISNSNWDQIYKIVEDKIPTHFYFCKEMGFLIATHLLEFEKTEIKILATFLNEADLNKHQWHQDCFFIDNEGIIYLNNLTKNGLNLVNKIKLRNSEINQVINQIRSNLDDQQAGFLKIEMKKLISGFNRHNIPTIIKIESWDNLLEALREVALNFYESPRKKNLRLDAVGHYYQYD